MRYVCVNHTTAGVDDAKRVRDALSEGGTVEMPLGETFWSPAFGVWCELAL